MRHIGMIVMGSFALSMAAATQNDAPKPKVSKDPLTAEQIAVYRTVLDDYTKDSDGRLNLANKTEPVDQPEPFFDKSCVQGLELENADNSVSIAHELSPAVALHSRIVLVDPVLQQRKVEENDPQKLVKRAIDDREQVTEKQVDNSVMRAFETGLFTLSEIVFDKHHRRAAVAYSFVCGELCGNGDTLILKKVGQKWKISKRCGGWVS
jgi:hypothetical protein